MAITQPAAFYLSFILFLSPVPLWAEEDDKAARV